MPAEILAEQGSSPTSAPREHNQHAYNAIEVGGLHPEALPAELQRHQPDTSVEDETRGQHAEHSASKRIQQQSPTAEADVATAGTAIQQGIDPVIGPKPGAAQQANVASTPEPKSEPWPEPERQPQAQPRTAAAAATALEEEMRGNVAELWAFAPSVSAELRKKGLFTRERLQGAGSEKWNGGSEQERISPNALANTYVFYWQASTGVRSAT